MENVLRNRLKDCFSGQTIYAFSVLCVWKGAM